MSLEPLSLLTEDKRFCMDMHMKGTIVCNTTYSPSDDELENYPHIVLSSPHSWDPQNITFLNVSMNMNEYRGGSSNVSSITMSFPVEEDHTIDDNDDTDSNIIFDFN